jgi:hypothetical protein
MKKHHPVNYSVSKDDAGSSEGSGGATHLQRLFQALKGLTGDTRGAQELVDCWARTILFRNAFRHRAAAMMHQMNHRSGEHAR